MNKAPKTNADLLVDYLEEMDVEQELIVLTDMDEAIDSLVYAHTGYRVVYCYHKIIDILMNRDGLTREDAHEYFSYNIAGAYMGVNQPIYKYLQIVWKHQFKNIFKNLKQGVCW